ncbi:hypothetical protein [Roseinatronobacter alkalisoli]|uniref:Uncharacterized protein n=1 Tax=Roseinatronobacter alkalisoli TaxID=3028235 RepID=A0ABT5TFE8_9RHOB|nr:hypothetical protein [Roseinatronobacter sp. HJB301]MDD7973852.1 hypothetical protein [Roseinatronobacter sp. HJB301]
MISLSVIDARVRRQKIAEQAGNDFVSRDVIRSRIRVLENFPKQQFLFAIFQSEARWTAISVNKLIGCYDGKLSELQIQGETEKIHHFFGEVGGKEKSDVELADGRKFWMKSVGVSCSFQNIMLMLEGLPEAITLDE